MLYENVLNFVIFLRKHNIFTFNYYTRRDILYINSVMYGCNLFLVLLTDDLLSIHLDWPKEKNINKSITNIRKKYKTLKTLKNVILWNFKKKLTNITLKRIILNESSPLFTQISPFKASLNWIEWTEMD